MATAHSQARYRWSYVGIWALGTVAFVALIVAGYPVAGAVAFALAAVTAVGVVRGFEGVVFDERDRAVVREASSNTIAVLGITSAVVFPTLTALWGLGLFAWPAYLTPIAFFVSALFTVWLVMLVLARR